MSLLEITCRELLAAKADSDTEKVIDSARRLRAGSRRIGPLFSSSYPALDVDVDVKPYAGRLDGAASLLVESSRHRNRPMAERAITQIQSACTTCHFEIRDPKISIKPTGIPGR